ncbi:MAG: stage II sporulation protein M [archaeon]
MGLLDLYKESWEFIKESRNYIYLVVGLFFLSALFGFLFPIFFVETIQQFIQQVVSQTEGMNFLQLAVFIIQNNITVSFFGMLFGIVLGIFPLILSFFNGYVLGFVSNSVVSEAGFLPLLQLVPHGIFEIPALFLALALGLRMGVYIFIKDKIKKNKGFKYIFENCLKVFLLVIIPFLILAGVIEALLIVLAS